MIIHVKPNRLRAFEYGIKKFRYVFKSLRDFERELENIKYELVSMSLNDKKPAMMNISITNWGENPIGFKLIIDMEKEAWDVIKI